MRVVKPHLVRRTDNGNAEARSRELEQVLEQTGEAVPLDPECGKNLTKR